MSLSNFPSHHILIINSRDGHKANRIHNTRLSYERVKQASFGPPRLDGNNSGRRVSEAVQ